MLIYIKLSILKKISAVNRSLQIYINNSLIDYQPAVKEIIFDNIEINNFLINIEKAEFNAEMQQFLSS